MSISEKRLKNALSAEVQAIAIYEAEVFWIRSAGRSSLLREILTEEKEHQCGLAKWAQLGSLTLFLNRLSGWILGSFLALLPWPFLCKVQAWAEREASKIYAKTLRDLECTNDAVPINLRETLEHARDQEVAHARRFEDKDARLL